MMSDVRVAPLPVKDWPAGLLERTEAILGGPYRAEAGVYSTLANAPTLFESWLHLGSHLLRRSTLDPRDRELVILRTTAIAKARYPFTQHTRIGGEVGLSNDDIEAIIDGVSDPRWASIDRLMLLAVDELMVNGQLSEGVWSELTASFSTPQVLDLIATVAFYRMASWLLNVSGTALDPGQENRLRPAEPRISTRWRRPEEVRLTPVPLDRWPADLLADTEDWPRFHRRPELRAAGVYSTLANHPDLLRAIGPVMAHLLVDNSLEDRHRELVIVRSCLRDHGEYPYRQHVRIGAQAGLSEPALAALAQSKPHLADAVDASLVSFIDQLHDHNAADDETWARASTHFTNDQLFDAVVTAGFYGLISFVLSSAGTTLEEGDILLPHDAPAKAFS